MDERVLIPRNETEILVEDAINYIKKKSCKSVFEIGVGSGCIAISIALETETKVKGSDISKAALEVANLNARKLDAQVDFLELDILDDHKYDFIISNPPYIKELADKSSVHVQTDEFEPHVALYLKDTQYFAWFENLFEKVRLALNTDGAFFMEGHEDHLESLEQVAKKYFEFSELKKDYTGRTRFLHVFAPITNI